MWSNTRRKWAGADKIVLAGGSYGGFIAQDYALAHPDRLIALILRGTWAWGTAGMMQALKAVLSSKRVKVDAERQYRMWTGILRDDDDFARGVEEMQALFGPDTQETDGNEPLENKPQIGRVHSQTQNFAFSHNMPRFDVRHRLRHITAPTLVVVGRQDLVAPVAFSEEIAKGIPGAELHIFEQSGHNPANDERDAFQERLWRYISVLGV